MRKGPLGAIIFGITLVLTSVGQIYYIPHITNYKEVNPGVPDSLLFIRYGISYLLRMTGLACGIGAAFIFIFLL